MEKGDGIFLDAADGSYVIEGTDMAPEMVGKTVKVTGTVAEKDNVKVINVLVMEEIADSEWSSRTCSIDNEYQQGS